MRIVHRITLLLAPWQRARLVALGVEVPPGEVMMGAVIPSVVLEIDDTHAAWPELAALFREWRSRVWSEARFDDDDRDRAAWLGIRASAHGYPEPKDAFGFRALTYDVSSSCGTCHVGVVQRAPFRMAAQPTWGELRLLQLGSRSTTRASRRNAARRAIA